MEKENEKTSKIVTDKFTYQVAIDNENVSAMKDVMNEYIEFGYEKIIEHEYNGDLILVYVKSN